ncbi:MAG: ATP phosphoribosyltransferase regulatory subunit [Candidatus Campbellbacteria bacterium]|nr:ATP phosphoribosyltransferase regulatory subunit [Candidatus Campbellbacteria bacterium]
MFGYKEYNASPLEYSELYTDKTSEEIVSEQTYTFMDRGGRNVTLRPEMTPTVARMIASRRKAMAFPQRLFSIPNVFRYERPQRGRLREHYQLNADLFGIDGIDAEIEIIDLANELLKRFGLKEDQYEIYINDRSILEDKFEELELDPKKKQAVYRLLDKKDKIDDFDEKLNELIGGDLLVGLEANERIDQLIEELSARGINNVKFKPYLVRGFDYYTGVIFEIFDTNPDNSRSLFGGGRYDDLLEVFGEEPVSAVGFGMGDVTIRDVLETYDLLPKEISFTDIYVCVSDRQYKVYADNVATRLRKNGIRTVVDMRYDTIDSQLKRSKKYGSKFALVVDEEAFNSDKLILKDEYGKTLGQKSLEEVVAIYKREV